MRPGTRAVALAKKIGVLALGEGVDLELPDQRHLGIDPGVSRDVSGDAVVGLEDGIVRDLDVGIAAEIDARPLRRRDPISPGRAIERHAQAVATAIDRGAARVVQFHP